MRSQLHQCGERKGRVSEEARQIARAAAIVARLFGLRAGDLTRAARREPAVVRRARHLAIYLIHVGAGIAASRTAAAFMRDRATVAYACQRIEAERDDPAFDHVVVLLEGLMTDGRASRGDLS
ncbi:MAG: helix-turn-helix domain-containing protein [Flavobacteriaceae bacterium]